jgi:hypothetical protein
MTKRKSTKGHTTDKRTLTSQMHRTQIRRFCIEIAVICHPIIGTQICVML